MYKIRNTVLLRNKTLWFAVPSSLGASVQDRSWRLTGLIPGQSDGDTISDKTSGHRKAPQSQSDQGPNRDFYKVTWCEETFHSELPEEKSSGFWLSSVSRARTWNQLCIAEDHCEGREWKDWTGTPPIKDPHRDLHTNISDGFWWYQSVCWRVSDGVAHRCKRHVDRRKGHICVHTGCGRSLLWRLESQKVQILLYGSVLATEVFW